MKMHYMIFLDIVPFLLCSLRKIPEAFGLNDSKYWYRDYFKTEENLDYIGPTPNVSH